MEQRPGIDRAACRDALNSQEQNNIFNAIKWEKLDRVIDMPLYQSEDASHFT
jgi:hypothetical protein